MNELYSSNLNNYFNLLGLLTNTYEQSRKSACDLAGIINNRTPLVLHLPDLINNGVVSEPVSDLF